MVDVAVAVVVVVVAVVDGCFLRVFFLVAFPVSPSKFKLLSPRSSFAEISPKSSNSNVLELDKVQAILSS